MSAATTLAVMTVVSIYYMGIALVVFGLFAGDELSKRDPDFVKPILFSMFWPIALILTIVQRYSSLL